MNPHPKEEHSPVVAKTFKHTSATVQKFHDAASLVVEKEDSIIELDNENYGAPPENSGISGYKKGKVSSQGSLTEPQAWEDKRGNWFYNWPGAMQLAKTLGRTLPNIDQLVNTMLKNPEKFRETAGSKNPENGKYEYQDRYIEIWSGSVHTLNKTMHYAYLKKDETAVFRYWKTLDTGLSVRFIRDET